jgi:hypothetical protein
MWKEFRSAFFVADRIAHIPKHPQLDTGTPFFSCGSSCAGGGDKGGFRLPAWLVDGEGRLWSSGGVRLASSSLSFGLQVFNLSLISTTAFGSMGFGGSSA